MRFKFLAVVVFIVLAALPEWLRNLPVTSNNKLPLTEVLIFSSPTPSANSTATGGFEYSILIAIIGALGIMFGAVITGCFLVYQIRRNIKLEQEKITAQKDLEQERMRSARDIIRLQDEIAADRAEKNRELQHLEILKEQEYQLEEEEKVSKIRIQAIDEYVKTYREALQSDPRIAHLQILDMSRPLNVINIYVRLRVHQEVKPHYQLAPSLVAAEMQRDPNILLRESQKYLENRFISALDPIEAIRAYTLCVIVGDPGAGKTTLLKYLALKSATQQLPDLPDLPIHIELNAFATSVYEDLLDFASNKWEERYTFPQLEARALMEKSLENGKALLLLDALDETMIGESNEVVDANYKRVTDAITNLATRYYKSPIVVTARKAGYHQRKSLEGFTELEVLDFRRGDIKQFVENWFTYHPNPKRQASATDLNNRLEQNSRIQALAANPLLLSLILIVYEAQLDLPDRRAELYKLCVDTLLTRWDATRDIRRRREFKPEHKRQLLQEVAWHFHNQGRRYFPDDELLKVIADFLPAVDLPAEQNERVLIEIASENSILKPQAQGWHGFLHLTLQEYFVAQHAADRNLTDELLEHLGDPWWDEVILLYSGCTSDASPLLRKLLLAGGEIALILAGRCLVAHPTVREISLREQITSQLLDILKGPSSTKEEQVFETLAKLTEIGGTKVNEQILSLLQDTNVYKFLRLRIISILGRSGNPSIIPGMLSLLQDTTLDKDIRVGIAYALGELGDRSAVPGLLTLLQDVSLNKTESETIASALSQLGDRSVVPNLLSLLQEADLDKFLRLRIIDTLGQLRDYSVIPSLLSMLQDIKTDKEVCISITFALSQLGDRSVVPNLLSLLQEADLDKEAHTSIIVTLGQLGDRSVVPNLLSLLQEAVLDKEVRISAIDALGQLGDNSVIPNLLLFLQDTNLDKEVRISIIDALGQLGDCSVVPTLLSMLQDVNLADDLRRRIAYTLGQLGDRSVVPTLLSMLQDVNLADDLRKSIAYTLGQLGDRSVVPSLRSILREPKLNQKVRMSITEAINLLEDNEIEV